MYYNRILHLWVLDPLDYLLLSALIGSLLASHLKKHLSEKVAMERLKKSIINKSKSRLGTPGIPISESQKYKTKRIYKFALENRGGQSEYLKIDPEYESLDVKLAEQIEKMVQRLASFLKERELKGVLKIFFRNGRLILELILVKCKIDITYGILTEGVSTQVIVITSTMVGVAGFTISWISAGATLVAPPLLVSSLLLRSVSQQILHQREYWKVKEKFKRLLNDDNIKETLKEVFREIQDPVSSSSRIEMGPSDLDKNPKLKHDFSGKSSEEIKKTLQEKFGLVENNSDAELEEIIKRKVKKKPKGKTVYFRDLIDEIDKIPDSGILDAEIIEKPIRVKTDNEL